MKKAILGKKLGMTQLFTENGSLVPVTVVEAGPCTVTQVKTVEKDGYSAVRVGFSTIPETRVKALLNKPDQGQFIKANVPAARYLRELRLDDADKYEVGNEIKTDVFASGEKIDVSGISRGKGYAGPMQRWNLHRGPMAHGSKYHRGVGSLSANSDPSKVFKNKKMSGQLGNEKVTVQGLEVVKVDAERNLLFIKGGVPGPEGGLLFIRNTVKA